MFHQQTNKPYFEIKLSEIEDDSIGVLRFEGKEEISDLYEYKIDIVSRQTSLDSSKILNKPARFSFIRGDEKPEQINGIISSFEQYGRLEELSFYKLTLVPKLWRLKLVYQNEIYQNMKIDDIIKEILSDAGLKGSSLKIDFKNQYPTSEYLVQYRETNFNFLNRRLEYYGIYYYFDNSGDADIVVFADSNSKLPDLTSSDPIDFNENQDQFGDGESIFRFLCKENVVIGTVQLKDYNYLYPEKQLMCESQLDPDSPGLYYDYGDNFDSEKEGGCLAKVRNQELLCGSMIFEGYSDNRLLRAGHRFDMENHFRDSWNNEYVITKVLVKGSQHGMYPNLTAEPDSSPVFECSFTTIPFNMEFRPKRKTPVPKITGVMSGRVDGPGSEEIFIDEHGRYKSKMFFDISDTKNGEASSWIRLQQTSSGAGYGFHFPNRIGTELIWACVDGNVDRPVGLGTIPNPSESAPVVDKNKLDNIIRTASGNQLVMNDKENETQIYINTPDNNKIMFDDKDDNITVSSKDKYLLIFDDKNENITVQSKNGHLLVLDDKNEKIEVQSKKGHRIGIDDSAESITLTDSGGGNSLLIDISNNKIVIKTDNGNIDIQAPNGKIDIKATELNIETTGDTKLKAANIQSEADVDYKIKASNVNEEASMDFKMKGMNMEAKGDMNVKVEGGMNFEAKGGVAAKVEGGATADFKAGAKASLQAAIVMIN